MIVPPVYPWSAFDDRRFLVSWRKPIAPEGEGPGRVSIHSTSEFLRQRLLSEYNQVRYEIVGLLKGDFGVSGDGMMLFDREGAPISINFPNDSFALGQVPYEHANDPIRRENRAALYCDWDNVPFVDCGAVFSHIYHANYYHYTLEFIQKFRLLGGFPVTTVLMPGELVNSEFKRDLVRRTMGERVIRSTSHAVRVRDPVIAQTFQSEEGLFWLRRLYEPNSAPDGRKFYVRRTPAKVRRGNNISEDASFLRMLEGHGFQAIDFGNGEKSIQEQIRMLDGASVLLTAHGAGLTNLAYLQAPLRVIEVFGPAVLSTSFMRMSTTLGFEHAVIISEVLNEQGDIVVDCDLIDALLKA